MSYRAEQRVRDRKDPRAPGFVARYRAGESQKAIAADSGLSQDRVKDLIAANMDGDERRTLRLERMAEAGLRRRVLISAAEARRGTELRRRIALDRRCVFCEGLNLRGPHNLTCSRECAKAWVVARYQINEQYRLQHRLQQAKSVLANPSRYPTSSVRLAKRLLSDNPPPPNRTWKRPNSAATRTAQRVAS